MWNLWLRYKCGKQSEANNAKIDQEIRIRDQWFLSSFSEIFYASYLVHIMMTGWSTWTQRKLKNSQTSFGTWLVHGYIIFLQFWTAASYGSPGLRPACELPVLYEFSHGSEYVFWMKKGTLKIVICSFCIVIITSKCKLSSEIFKRNLRIKRIMCGVLTQLYIFRKVKGER